MNDSHQQWRSYKATAYVSRLGLISTDLEALMKSGATLAYTDVDDLYLVIKRLRALAEKEDEKRKAAS